MKTHWLLVLWIFNLTYLFWGGAYFVQGFNLEFMIYVVVILLIVGGVLLTSEWTKFPPYMLWMFSFWGLLHVLGGAVETRGGVLFAYRIIPIIDLGGEFFVLKYDQVVHMYLYGVVALMSHHILQRATLPTARPLLIAALAVFTSVGISVLNEIMEFIISLNMQNGVGGYENTMLDLIFNLSGAIVAMFLASLFWKKSS